jgi:hypothetical protein
MSLRKWFWQRMIGRAELSVVSGEEEVVPVPAAAIGQTNEPPTVASAHMNAAQLAAVSGWLEPIATVYGGGGFYLGAKHIGKAAGRMIVKGQLDTHSIAADITAARRQARDDALAEAARLGADLVLFNEPPTAAVITNAYNVLVDGTAFRTKERNDEEVSRTVTLSTAS